MPTSPAPFPCFLPLSFILTRFLLTLGNPPCCSLFLEYYSLSSLLTWHLLVLPIHNLVGASSKSLPWPPWWGQTSLLEAAKACLFVDFLIKKRVKKKKVTWTSLPVQGLRLLLPMYRVQVQSLVEKLRSHIPPGQKNKTENRSNVVTNSKKTLKMIHIKKS